MGSVPFQPFCIHIRTPSPLKTYLHEKTIILMSKKRHQHHEREILLACWMLNQVKKKSNFLHVFYLLYLLSTNHVSTNLWTADMKKKMKIRFKYPLLHIAMALSPNDRPCWMYCPFSMSPSALHFFSVRINEKIWKRGVQWMNKKYIVGTQINRCILLWHFRSKAVQCPSWHRDVRLPSDGV